MPLGSSYSRRPAWESRQFIESLRDQSTRDDPFERRVERTVELRLRGPARAAKYGCFDSTACVRTLARPSNGCPLDDESSPRVGVNDHRPERRVFAGRGLARGAVSPRTENRSRFRVSRGNRSDTTILIVIISREARFRKTALRRVDEGTLESDPIHRQQLGPGPCVRDREPGTFTATNPGCTRPSPCSLSGEQLGSARSDSSSVPIDSTMPRSVLRHSATTDSGTIGSLAIGLTVHRELESPPLWCGSFTEGPIPSRFDYQKRCARTDFLEWIAASSLAELVRSSVRLFQSVPTTVQ